MTSPKSNRVLEVPIATTPIPFSESTNFGVADEVVDFVVSDLLENAVFFSN